MSKKAEPKFSDIDAYRLKLLGWKVSILQSITIKGQVLGHLIMPDIESTLTLPHTDIQKRKVVPKVKDII